MVRDSVTRPYRPPLSLFVLIAIVPLYIFIPVFVVEMPGFRLHRPVLPVDFIFPVVPAWAVVYGALYAFLIILPLFAIREPRHARLTVHAYLFVWLVSYAVFVLYPTAAPRPPKIDGSGFFAASLRFLYDSDPPFNCFPSLHVAHSFVSGFALRTVHRRVGHLSLAAACLVALSTLFTRQHYVADVAAGVALATAAWAIFLRRCSPEDVSTFDRESTPALAATLAALLTLAVGGYWMAYRLHWIF